MEGNDILGVEGVDASQAQRIQLAVKQTLAIIGLLKKGITHHVKVSKLIIFIFLYLSLKLVVSKKLLLGSRGKITDFQPREASLTRQVSIPPLDIDF